MKSMTGFGRGTAQSSHFQCIVEVKTVNARYCDMYLKMPRLCQSMEDKVRQYISQHVARGKVEVTVQVTEIGDMEKNISINHLFAQQLKEALVAEGFFPTTEAVTIESMLAISRDWIRVEDAPLAEEEIEQVVMTALAESVEQLVIMRRTEGESMAKDLRSRLCTLQELHMEMELHKDVALEHHKERLLKRLTETSEKAGLTVSMDRFLQEVAILSDKTDIAEELVRLASHIDQFQGMLEETEPVGRKLDFLVQEMNREVNTMGSKGAHLEILNRVVLLKCEIEKMREQIQNIE